jgi:hypothetical protein
MLDPTRHRRTGARLPHIYQATAYLQLGQLDAAVDAVRPVLDLSPERQIPWIRKRQVRFAGILPDERCAGSHDAIELSDEYQGPGRAKQSAAGLAG